MPAHYATKIFSALAALGITAVIILSGFSCVTAQTPQRLSAEQWRADLAFLTDELPKQHPNAFRRVKREVFDAAARHLNESIPQMNEDEIVAGLMQLVALIQDGHTSLFPATLFQSAVFPVRMYQFEDGLFVRNAAPAYSRLVGARVLKVGSVDAAEAVKRMSTLVAADNEMGRLENAPLLLSIPQFVMALKIGTSKERLQITVRLGDKEEVVEVAPASNLGELIRPPASWSDASRAVSKPLYLKNPTDRYWFEYDKDQKLVYVQENAVLNKDGETLAQFYARVMDIVAKDPVEKFVIDLRNNDGGNNGLSRPVVIGLIKSRIDERGRLFVITGRATFSAAQNFVNELEKYTNVIFVGEPTAGHPNHYGDARPIELPNSKLRVNVSTIYWQDVDPRDTRKWTAPGIAAALTSTDYKNGIDPAMKAIIAYRPETSFGSLIAKAETDVAEFARLFAAFKADPTHKYIDTEAAVNRLGYTLLQQKRAAEAVEIFRLNVKENPNSANVYDSLGDGLQALGNTGEAVKAYEKALSIDPNYASSRAALQKLKGK